jgi:hypothetical protein
LIQNNFHYQNQMPIRTYRDQNNATIIFIILISFIFSIIFTCEYYSTKNVYIERKMEKYVTICWSIFGSFSFIYIITNSNFRVFRDNISFPDV